MTKTKNWKEPILKNANSIPKFIHTIAGVGAEYVNDGSSKGADRSLRGWYHGENGWGQ